ncbi:MAG: putative sugar O-methyltransferase [Solirubrobacteraceae bacterium]
MSTHKVERFVARAAGLARRAGMRTQLARERLDIRARVRRRKMVQHETGARRPRFDAVLVPDKLATEHDVAIAERLLAAYRAASSAPQPPRAADRADVWTRIMAGQGRLASILRRGDPRELAAYLCNLSRHDASEGLEQGSYGFQRVMGDPSYRRFVALMVGDALVSLAEAVGALAVENPEQGPFGQSIHRDPAELVERISARVGTDVAPPDVDGGLLKIDTGRGLFGGRDANAIYTAHLLRQTTLDLRAPRICEIGAGSGRVAYWSRRFGLDSYTVVDLPHINVVQGYYLLKSLPGEEVSLYGEDPPGVASGRVQILPAHAIADLQGPLFDLVLNQDSFPEIDPATVADYLRWITRCCEGSLLSINFESKPPYGRGRAHLSVPELVGEVGGFELTHRFPYWLRRGYVVELYRVAR